MDGGLGAALSQATIASTRRTSVPTVHDTPLPLPADPADPLAGPTGATAQTGGFINAGTSPKSTGYGGFGSAVGFGGGLASSPNVPKPGSSINPATGLPHTAGLTRAELEAKKAQASSSSSAVAIDGSKLSDLSGREQAARQLTATAEEGITPGLEVPGGWGHVKQVPVPGSGPNAPTSVYEDIAEGLEKVGNAAFNLIPQGLKNALNPEAPVDKGKQPMGSPPKGRRSSVNVFLENAKAGLESAKTGTANLLHDVQDTFQSDRRLSLGGNKTAGTTGSGGVFTSVTNFFAESVNTVENQTNAKIAGPAAPRTSLPSNEVAGALPGERSTGVGALPGKSTEAGVAVLPEEKKLDPELPLGADPALKQQAPLGSNQSLLPGETAAVVPAASTSNETAHRDDSGGVGDLPGKPSETGVAILPEEKKLNHDLPADSSKDEHSGLSTLKTDVSTPNEHKDSSTGLAPPLPATVLGVGAAKGATDVEEAGLPAASASEPPSSVASEITNSTLDTATAPTESRHAADRATSTASITAIRHGHEGHKPSPLAESTVKEDLHSEEKEATGLTHDDKAVAPSTVDETKPDLTHSEAATSRDSSNPVTPRSPTSKLHNDSAVSTSTPTTATKTTPAAVSPTTHANHDSNVGHNRSGSTASTGSNGKKKVGFMNKLKGEMKVIGGKISHDEKKIQEGERLKHGA